MKRFQLLLQSDYEVDPSRIVLTVHPNDYNAVAAMIREGLVLKGEPQTIDAVEWAAVELLTSGCPCRACLRERDARIGGRPVEQMMMVVCRLCGYKRCPHATDHRNSCTNSNESGQPGSAYA